MSIHRFALCASFLPLLPFWAAAQDSDVPFNAIVVPSCTVVPGTPGVLGTAEGGVVLSSGSGAHGTALVTATGLGYQASVDQPFSFDLAPPDGDTDVAYAAGYEASGATLAARVNAGTPLSLLLGTTTLTIDAEARKTTGAFPAGTYRLLTTVRCVQP